MYVAAEDRIHHPSLEVVTLDSGDRAVVLDPEQDDAAAQVRHRDDLSGELLGANVIALELHAGVFAVGDDFQ